MKLLNDYQPILSSGESIEDITKLSPLEALQEYRMIKNYFDRNAHEKIQTLRVFSREDELYKIIETALQRYESLQIVEPIVKKKLKALEIIKEKKVDFINFDIWTYEEYLECQHDLILAQISEEDLTQEEFDLLKEVLK